MIKKYEVVNKSIKDLDDLRDEEGFINLDSLYISFRQESKELRGNQNRLKNWVKFNDALVLIKGEISLDGNLNYGVYGEIIVEEMAKFFNIPCSHYDLIKVTYQDKLIRGVMSYAMDNDKELISLHDLIGEEDVKDEDFPDAVNLNFTLQSLEKSFRKLKVQEDKISQLIIEYKKRLAFALLVLETDKHIENISFLKDKDDITLAPNYDSEASLLLDTDIPTINLLLANYISLVNTVIMVAQPRIGLINKRDNGGLENYWEDTLEALIVDDEVYDYCSLVLKNKIEMDDIFMQIEGRIKASIPDEAKLIAKHSYLIRYKVFCQILDGTIY